MQQVFLVVRMMLLLGFFLTGTQVQAQHLERKFEAYSIEDNLLQLRTNDGAYRFFFYTPEILETSFIPQDQVYDTVSHAVVLEAEQVPFEVQEDSASLYLDSEGLDVRIQKFPFQVAYYYQGDHLLSEKTGYSRTGEMEKLDFSISETEALFGGGARALGMDRRGHRLELYNKAHYGYTSTSDLLNYTLPVVLSSRRYALHFDNAPIGFLDLDSQHTNTLSYETIGGRKTYQVIAGDNWKQIIGNYTLLTGRQPLPPRWTFGNFASRFGYHSQREVMQTLEMFREDRIPVDAVILDLFWFGHDIKGTMGNLEFVRDSFPEPEKMMQDLRDHGIKTVLITEPFILTSSNRWQEAVEEEILATDSLGRPYTYDFYFGHTGLIDIFDPKAQKWFWEKYRNLIRMGVSGWWGDLGEPEVHPSAVRHAMGTADEVHNIYGHYWAKMLYQGYQQDFPEQRPFILMRAGAAGSQRYGLIPWSGDVSRSWGGLQSQPEIALQMGLQGLAYMHSDLGGFAGDHLDNELYVRWLQYGVFQPVFRPHAQEAVPSEPVFKEPATKELARQAVRLRYRLLPYNYTLGFENSTSGMPLMRPLFFEEPENFRLYFMSETYLWGPDILVSPVLQSRRKQKEIYFPSTAAWIDFYDGSVYQGGKWATIEVEREHIPTFVKAGAFLPLSAPLQTTADFTSDDLEIHYFYKPGTESSGKYYHDDGSTPGTYKNGKYEILTFQGVAEEKAISIGIRKELGRNQEDSWFPRIKLIIRNYPDQPSEVSSAEGSVDWEYNSDRAELRVDLSLPTRNNTLIIN